MKVKYLLDIANTFDDLMIISRLEAILDIVKVLVNYRVPSDTTNPVPQATATWRSETSVPNNLAWHKRTRKEKQTKLKRNDKSKPSNEEDLPKGGVGGV